MPKAGFWDVVALAVVLFSLAGYCFLERNEEVPRDVFLSIRVILSQALNGRMRDVKTMTAFSNELARVEALLGREDKCIDRKSVV